VCGAFLWIFARRREEDGERGAKLTDLEESLAGEGVGDERGEGEAVEGGV
jgi:hypothetical protein